MNEMNSELGSNSICCECEDIYLCGLSGCVGVIGREVKLMSTVNKGALFMQGMHFPAAEANKWL